MKISENLFVNYKITLVCLQKYSLAYVIFKMNICTNQRLYQDYSKSTWNDLAEDSVSETIQKSTVLCSFFLDAQI